MDQENAYGCEGTCVTCGVGRCSLGWGECMRLRGVCARGAGLAWRECKCEGQVGEEEQGGARAPECGSGKVHEGQGRCTRVRHAFGRVCRGVMQFMEDVSVCVRGTVWLGKCV